MASERPVVRRFAPAQRREQIVEAARTVIAERGLAATTVREIAAAAGVSTGTVTHHFESLDRILEAVLRSETTRVLERRRELLRERTTALERLLGLAQTLADDADADTHAYWRLWLDYWARAAHDRRLAAWQADHYREWRAAVEEAIAAGMASGELRRGDPAPLAFEITALIDGFMVQALLADGPEGRGSEGRLRAALERMLGSVADG
jgi:AcrR family transcriptional regulator